MKKPIFFLLAIFQLGIANTQNTIDITYIANEGFLVSDGTTKILIDGVFTEDWGRYHAPSEEIQQKQRDAAYPFDNIDFLLVTHTHADHLNTAFTTEHLSNNDQTILLGSPAINDALETFAIYSSIVNRIVSVNPETNTKIDTTVKGVSFTAMLLNHADDAGNSILNLGYIFTINEITVFHPGDASTVNLELFENLNLSDNSIDIAFLPRWFLNDEYGDYGYDIIKYLNPKAIIPMHIPIDKYESYKQLAEMRDFSSQIYFMETPMKQLSFIDEGNTLSTFVESKYAYFGQTPPGNTPEIIVPGIISKNNRWESNIVFSNDGRECYVEVMNPPDYKSQILFSKYNNASWSDFADVPFSINNHMSSPFMSPDNESFYFLSTETDFSGLDIYRTNRTDTGWSEPVLLPAPINSSVKETEYFEKDNIAYVTSERTGGIGGLDIWKVTIEGDQYSQAINMGENINSSAYDFSPCISPDGTYLIFGSERDGRDGLAHLYICFKNSEGSWTEPINMNSAGHIINNNVAHHSVCTITPDGKYLFFKRHENFETMDIYWVSTSIINDLKAIALPNE